MPAKKNSRPKLLVVFDTNVLYTQVASDLLRHEVCKLIQENSAHVDLSVTWFLPATVVDERHYQMRHKAFEFLPSITKLEKLLGVPLNITPDILEHRVDEAIKRQLTEYNIEVLPLEIGSVDWTDLINRSVFRKPPFAAGENEKGFRDSLIAEAFLQLVGQSPVTPSVCRLALVTDDGRLADFLRERTSQAKNVRILANVGELESLINTLVSKITEEFASELTEKAKAFFFQKGNENTLLYKENIQEQIQQQYGEQLKAVPKDELFRQNGTWWIGDPVFLKKERQRVHWSTPIKVEAKLFKFQYESPSPAVTTGVSTTATSVTSTAVPPSSYGLLGGLSGLTKRSSLSDLSREAKRIDVGDAFLNQ